MADTLDFLLEIGCEEMPSAPLMNAAKQLPKLVQKRLRGALPRRRARGLLS